MTPLEALKKLKECKYHFAKEWHENYPIVESALKEYEGAKRHIEELNKERAENSLKIKALEIVKEKEVDVETFKGFAEKDETCETYNKFYRILSKKYDVDYSFKYLTQEEYDLLKEYFYEKN